MKNRRHNRGRGRPSSLTARSEAVLLALIGEGSTIGAACKRARTSYSAIVRRRSENADFRLRLTRAQVAGSLFMLDRVEEDLLRANPKTIAVVRERASHMRWKASKLLPALFGDLGRLPSSEDLPGEDGQDESVLDVARRIAFTLTLAGRQGIQGGSKPKGAPSKPEGAKEE